MQQDLTVSLEQTQKVQKIIRKTNQISYHQKRLQKLENGQWNKQENKRYFKFLKSNCKTFKNKIQRRKRKIFEKMSQRIQSRSANQCRSHHQKMIQKFKTQEVILKHLSDTYLSFLNESCQISSCEQKQNQRYITTLETQNTDSSSQNRLKIMQDESNQLQKEYSQDTQKPQIKNFIELFEFDIVKVEFNLFDSLIV